MLQIFLILCEKVGNIYGLGALWCRLATCVRTARLSRCGAAMEVRCAVNVWPKVETLPYWHCLYYLFTCCSSMKFECII